MVVYNMVDKVNKKVNWRKEMNLKKTIRNSVLKRAIIPVWILLGVLNYIMSAPSRHDEMERVYEEQAKALGLSEPLFHVRSVITMVIPWVVVGIIVLLVTLYKIGRAHV